MGVSDEFSSEVLNGSLSISRGAPLFVVRAPIPEFRGKYTANIWDLVLWDTLEDVRVYRGFFCVERSPGFKISSFLECNMLYSTEVADDLHPGEELGIFPGFVLLSYYPRRIYPSTATVVDAKFCTVTEPVL